MKSIVIAKALILAFVLTIAILTALVAVTGLGAGIVEMAIIMVIAAVVGFFVARSVGRKQKS